MTKKTTEVQVNLRISPDLKDRLQAEAKHNGRSLNAELTAHLEASLSQTKSGYSQAIKKLDELLVRHQSSPRIQNIGKRLNHLLTCTNKIRYIRTNLTPSEVALRIGKTHAHDVESWFAGELEPSFTELRSLADFFACSHDWLLFGKGSPYPSEYLSNFDTVAEMTEFCSQPNDTEKQVSHIYFVRNATEAGELLIVKHYEDWRCTVYRTNIHVSNMVGNTGMRTRAILTMTLNALCESRWHTKTQSYIVHDDVYDQLAEGMLNPLSILHDMSHVPWMDDIWDKTMYEERKLDYWDGWTTMCIDNANYIQSRYDDDLEQIRKKTHPVFEVLNENYRSYYP